MQPARQKNGAQALGWSRSGLSTKIHASAQGMGQLIGFAITGGEIADITEAQGLLVGLEPARIGISNPPRRQVHFTERAFW